MSPRIPDRSLAEAQVIKANVSFYLQVAEKYDSYETYLFDPRLQKSLEDDLDKIGAHFVSRHEPPSCLDCGGGTGNLTLKMCRRGWAVTVVDVSEKMLSLLREKAQAQGHSPALIHSPIEQYLETSHETYDLITFSSVLHHLYSYLSVVEQAVQRLRPGGVFYSNYDPVAPRHSLSSRAFNSFDIAIAKGLFDPADVLPGIGRRLRKLFLRSDSVFRRPIAGPGDLAEFHVGTGVDDETILKLLKGRGFSIIQHQRFATGRTAFVKFLNEHLRLLESFKLIASLGSDKSSEKIAST